MAATGLSGAKASGTDVHSISGNPLFVNADQGDYTVAANSAALQVGFKNIPMNRFGVKKPSLKKIALQPVITKLTEVVKAEAGSPIVSFLGGKIKAVEGLGDRSAYGLPDEKGIILLEAGSGSIWLLSGLLAGDVIRKIGDQEVANVKELQNAITDKSSVSVEYMRNQKVYKVTLKIK